MGRSRTSRRSTDSRTAQQPPHSTPPWWLLLASLAVAAGTIRVLHVRALSRAAVFSVLLGDSKRYMEWAGDIAGGNWLGSGAFYQAPLYPYVLAAMFTVFGESVDAVRVAQALAGAVACVLVAIAGRALFDWRAGLLAGAALAVYPPGVFFDGHIQKASLDVILTAALVVAVARYQSDGRKFWLIVLGLALGCLTLNRENARVLYPVLVVWLLQWDRTRALTRRLRTVAVFTLATLVPIVPVAARNYYVAGEPLLSTFQLGPNFYIGNRLGASGMYEPLVPGRASVIYEEEDAVRLATIASRRQLSPSEVSSYWLRRALDEMRSDPAGWVHLMIRKLRFAVHAHEVMDTESIEFHASYSPVLRALTPFTYGVLLTLAIAGIVITAADVRRLALLYAVGLVLLGSVVIFFVLARYRHPVAPVLALFAGAALAGARDMWRQQPRRLLTAAACAAATALAANWPIPAASDESYANFGTELLRLERPHEAVPLLVKAVDRLPNDAGAHRDLALAYLKSGDAGAAAREYAAVVRLEPDNPANHRELAVAAEAAGDPAAALNGLREAARRDPRDVSTQMKLGDLFVRTDQAAEARRAYERALVLAADRPDVTVPARVRIASLDVAEGRIADALRLLQDAAAIARSSGQTAVADEVDATIDSLRTRRAGKSR